jgi:hypothetical protein
MEKSFMAKRFLILLFSISLLVSACAQSEIQATPTVEETVEPTPVEQEVANVSQSTATKEPGCTVTSQKPTPDPTRQALLPPASDDDWAKGGDEAYVTIIEYGDFQ